MKMNQPCKDLGKRVLGKGSQGITVFKEQIGDQYWIKVSYTVRSER